MKEGRRNGRRGISLAKDGTIDDRANIEIVAWNGSESVYNKKGERSNRASRVGIK